MALTRFRKVRAKDLLKNPFPESTHRGLVYSLYGGDPAHRERDKHFRRRWLAVTLPRELAERLRVIAGNEGYPLSPWLAVILQGIADRRDQVPEEEQELPEEGRNGRMGKGRRTS